MKKMKQIIKILILVIIISGISIIGNQVAAANINLQNEKQNNQNITKVAATTPTPVTNPSGGNDNLSGIIDAGKNWIQDGKKDQGDMTDMFFAEKFSGIGQVLVAIGVVTLLIVGGIMAIKWITATPDKQAKLKEQLIGLVISAVVIFGAIGIWNFIRGIGQKVENSLALNTQSSIVIAKK